MLLRARRLENDRNMMRIDDKFKLHVQGTKRKQVGDLDPNEPIRQQVKEDLIDEPPEELKERMAAAARFGPPREPIWRVADSAAEIYDL